MIIGKKSIGIAHGTCAALLAFFIVFFVSVNASAQDGAGAYESAKKRLSSLNSSESQLSRRDCWLSVIEAFGSVYLEYPTDASSDDALFMVGTLYERLYERSGATADIKAAVDAFGQLIREYPEEHTFR